MPIDLPMEDSPYRLQEHGPIFILGCPRSGTTFLSKCLAAIDGLEEFVGVLVPPRLMHQIGNPGSGMNRHELMLSVQDIFWQAFWRRIYFRNQRIVQLISKNISVQQFLKKPTLEHALFCYKEPFLCFAAEQFAAHFSNAKFIHIIRDGRDNADSMDRSYPHALSNEVLQDKFASDNKVSEIGMSRDYKGWRIPWWIPVGSEEIFTNYSKFERNVLMWKEMVYRARKIKDITGDDRYYEIRYEDFTQNPGNEAKGILDFLNVKMNDRISRKLKKAFSTSIGISKTNMPPEKIKAANAIIEPLLIELNYAV